MGDWSFAGGMKANPELYSRYEVLERLGEGTYGEVYRGRRKLDGLIVALKETRDPQCATREAEALLALNHPNVVKLIEYFVQGANLILVLEFMSSDLFRILEGDSGRIPESQVKGWMLQLLRGVEACHEASILHRDLKPSNLLVGADGSVKLADFGQARVVSPQSADLLGINDTIFERDELETTSSMEKEEIDAWINGTTIAKIRVKESTETRAGSSEDPQKPIVNVNDHGAGQCFCMSNENGELQERSDSTSGAGDAAGCRSLNCSMVRRDGLIVAWSNHFVEMLQKMESIKSLHDEELGRREWVLAEKNTVNTEQEKDSDFFCKLRSFLKRRARKPQKHFRWGRDTSDTERSQMIMDEEGGRLDYTCQELDTAVLQASTYDLNTGQGSPPISAMPSTRGKIGMRFDSNLSREIEVGKSDVEHMDNVGLRPLMGNETTDEEIVFSGLKGPDLCLLEENSKGSTLAVKESEPAYVNQLQIERPFDGTYTAQVFVDSGRVIAIGSHGGRDDTGSDSKRRKAYELENSPEEIVSTGQGLEMGLEGGSKFNDDETIDMETDAHLSELRAVRNRILYGKHRRTDSQKKELPSLQNGISIDPTGDLEASRVIPGVNNNLMSFLEKDVPPKIKESVVEGEETEKTEKTVRVLGLERVNNAVEGYRREVECAQEGTVPCRSEKEGTIRFWDGDQQRWESPYASDEDTGVEDPFDSKQFAGGKGYSRKAGNDLFFDDDGSCPVDQVPGYYAFGDSEVEDIDQEEGDMACQTRWYGPPDVRDSYVTSKLEVHEEGFQHNADEYSREIFGRYNDARLHDSEVHSQQEETESTYSSESGNKGSHLSPFVGTRWYKAPELLYGATKYGKGLDMWAVGCIFAECLGGKPLFPGITDIDQLSRIVRVLGAPNDNIWPGVSLLPDFDKISFSDERDLLSFRKLLPLASSSALKFLEKFLVYDPERRISAEAALQDAYFLEDPLPVFSHEVKIPSFRRDSSASEDWGEWRDPGSPFSDFEILDSAP